MNNSCTSTAQLLLCSMMKLNGDTIPYRQCEVEGCDRKHFGKGYCMMHHRRWWKYGNPLKLQRNPHDKRTHGMTGSVEYSTWNAMKRRCSAKNPYAYKYYAGRGIKVCDRWLDSFENFYEDMGEKPKGLSIDRINNDGDYCPENCKWATRAEQARNTRANKMITWKGETKCVNEWARIVGFQEHVIRRRLERGRSVKDILFAPIKKGPEVKITEKDLDKIISIYSKGGTTLKELGLEYGVHWATISRRIKKRTNCNANTLKNVS